MNKLVARSPFCTRTSKGHAQRREFAQADVAEFGRPEAEVAENECNVEIVGVEFGQEPGGVRVSSSGTAPDRALFTDFLATMNCTILQSGGRCWPGLHSDWRIPTIAELQSILDTSVAGCRTGTPCIHPIFDPTAASFYWSASSSAEGPASA